VVVAYLAVTRRDQTPVPVEDSTGIAR
jgi:hypothetical protein